MLLVDPQKMLILAVDQILGQASGVGKRVCVRGKWVDELAGWLVGWVGAWEK